MKKKVIVIGSGFGGLATASRLLSAGHEVRLFEKRDRPGGRAYVYKKDGFTFDGGPTVITAPFLFDELFQAARRNRSDYVTFQPCDPFYRIFDATGRTFDYNHDHGQILQEIGKWNPNDRKGYEAFLESTRAIFQKGFIELADQPFLNFRDMIRVVPDLIRLRSHQSVYKYVSRFIQDDFLRRCFSFHPLLVGGNPFDTTSIYSMIHYLEREWGVHYARGGTGALVQALVRLIEEQKGTIHLNAEAEQILVKNGRAAGVRLKNGEIHKADLVVSNADAAFTYKYLVPRENRRKYTDRKIDRYRYSMSLFVIYFGTRKRYNRSRLAHHNILLGNRYRGLIQDIFEGRELSDDFSLYLHMPSLNDPSLAPEGGETFYVLSPVPHLGNGTDWTQAAKPYRDSIIRFLEKNYLPDLEKNIVTERMITPLHFRDELNSYKGAGFSLEPVLTQSAWFRPHNQSEDLPGLYLTGAGTHPGAGLPGVLSSAKIVAKLIGPA